MDDLVVRKRQPPANKAKLHTVKPYLTQSWCSYCLPGLSSKTQVSQHHTIATERNKGVVSQLHTDTYTRIDTDTGSALITGESNEAETSRELETPSTTDINRTAPSIPRRIRQHRLAWHVY
jgi:streptogramin lyase